MITLQQHLEQSRAAILEEAKLYAKSYKVTLAEAIRDVRDEYAQGYAEGAEAMRSGDWDYGQE
jgi:hypothetical protein